PYTTYQVLRERSKVPTADTLFADPLQHRRGHVRGRASQRPDIPCKCHGCVWDPEEPQHMPHVPPEEMCSTETPILRVHCRLWLRLLLRRCVPEAALAVQAATRARKPAQI